MQRARTRFRAAGNSPSRIFASVIESHRAAGAPCLVPGRMSHGFAFVDRNFSTPWVESSHLETPIESLLDTSLGAVPHTSTAWVAGSPGLGNHIVSGTAGSGLTPSRRVNLLSQTESWSDASAWSRSNLNVTDGISDPFGGTAACRVTASANFGFIRQSGASPAFPTNNRVWLRRAAGSGAVYICGANTNSFTQLVTLTGSWQEFVIVSTGTTAAVGLQLDVSGDAVDVAFPDIRSQAYSAIGLPTYQRVGNVASAPRDYDRDPSAWALWLDNRSGTANMQTLGTLDLTATDRLCTSAVLVKTQDAAVQLALEISPNISANNGSAYLAVPGSAAALNIAFAAKGTAQTTPAPPAAAAIVAAISTRSEIATPYNAASVNGSAPTFSGGSLGTGNFGNHRVYYGSRAGIGLYFTGRQAERLPLILDGRFIDANTLAVISKAHAAEQRLNF